MGMTGTVKTPGPKPAKKKRYHLTIDLNRCKGCDLCVVVCPRKTLQLSKGINARGAHYAEVALKDGCSGCLQCFDICPDGAISIEVEEEAD